MSLLLSKASLCMFDCTLLLKMLLRIRREGFGAGNLLGPAG